MRKERVLAPGPPDVDSEHALPSVSASVPHVARTTRIVFADIGIGSPLRSGRSCYLHSLPTREHLSRCQRPRLSWIRHWIRAFTTDPRECCAWSSCTYSPPAS